MREDTTTKGALTTKYQGTTKSKWKNKKKESSTSTKPIVGKGKNDG